MFFPFLKQRAWVCACRAKERCILNLSYLQKWLYSRGRAKNPIGMKSLVLTKLLLTFMALCSRCCVYGNKMEFCSPFCQPSQSQDLTLVYFVSPQACLLYCGFGLSCAQARLSEAKHPWGRRHDEQGQLFFSPLSCLSLARLLQSTA